MNYKIIYLASLKYPSFLNKPNLSVLSYRQDNILPDCSKILFDFSELQGKLLNPIRIILPYLSLFPSDDILLDR